MTERKGALVLSESSADPAGPGETLIAQQGGVLVVSSDESAFAPIPGGAGSVTEAMIEADAVTNAKLANMAAHTYKGNATAGSANPTDLTQTELTAELNLATNTLQGMVAGGNRAVMGKVKAVFLTDADATIAPATDRCTVYILPAGTLTADRVLTIDNASQIPGVTGTVLQIVRLDLSAHAYTILNSTPSGLFTTAASQATGVAYQCYHSGGIWNGNTAWWTGT